MKKSKGKMKGKTKAKTKGRVIKNKPKIKKKIKPIVKKRKTKTQVKTSKTTPKISTKKVKAKKKAKTKSPLKPKTKKKTNIKARKKLTGFNEAQKNELLIWIEKIINLHKGQPGGLKSFAGIDDILDQHNQHYTEAGEKFDAIVKFGLDKDPRVIHQHFFVNVEGREEDVNDLYILLAKIAKEKISFAQAKEKIKSLFEKSLNLHQK